jgi:hypothetical protein
MYTVYCIFLIIGAVSRISIPLFAIRNTEMVFRFFSRVWSQDLQKIVLHEKHLVIKDTEVNVHGDGL